MASAILVLVQLRHYYSQECEARNFLAGPASALAPESIQTIMPGLNSSKISQRFLPLAKNDCAPPTQHCGHAG